LVLARHEVGEPVRTEEIAAALGAPRNYLGKTLNALVRHGILHSVRGPHGGFTLAVPPHRLTVADVVDLFAEPKIALKHCIMANRPCNPDKPCVAHERWTDVTLRARAPLMRTTIAELCGAEPFAQPDVPVADHTGAMLVDTGRNPIPTGTRL